MHIKNLKIKIVINMISVITIIDKSRDLFDEKAPSLKPKLGDIGTVKTSFRL